MDYSRAIRIVRSARGLSQKELSELAELNPGYISRIEKGTRQPTTKAIERISKALDVPLYLFLLLASGDTDRVPKAALAEDLLHVLLDTDETGTGNAKKQQTTHKNI
jgi:transcriptional regulator with XRE-family HTH domain